MSTSTDLTVGTITTNITEPWPSTWTYPYVNTPTVYTYPYYVQAEDDYANEVEVERGEHDATLRFYRNRGNGRTLVKTLTVPLGVLEWLKG